MSVTSTSTNFCAVIFLPPKMFEAIFPCADHHLRVGIDRDLVPLFCFAWSSVKETTTITNTTGKYLPSSQVLEAVGMFFFFFAPLPFSCGHPTLLPILINTYSQLPFFAIALVFPLEFDRHSVFIRLSNLLLQVSRFLNLEP